MSSPLLLITGTRFTPKHRLTVTLAETTMLESLFERIVRAKAAPATCTLCLIMAGCSPAPAPRASTPGAMETKGDPMDSNDNKILATRIVREIFNERNYDAADTLFSPEFHSHNARVPSGPQGIKAFARQFVVGFADFEGTIQEILADGDKVMIWLRWRGTHTGTFAGVPATGKRVEFDTVEIFRIAGGKVVEHWDIADRLALQSALGLVRPAG